MIIEFFGPAGAGKTTFAHALCKRLNERGHDADVVLSYQPGSVMSSLAGGSVVALRRISRAMIAVTAIAARPFASKSQFDLTLKLIRALPPRSLLSFVRLSQYILRLSHCWNLSTESGQIVIFDQAFIQVICTLALHNERATDASLQRALGLVPKADLVIRLNAPPEMLEARLRGRLRSEAPAERVFEADVDRNLAGIPFVDRVDGLLRTHRGASISFDTLDQPSLCKALDKAEEVILALKDRNGGAR
jgi:thymidylate kinase